MEQLNAWQEYWDNFLFNKYGKENVETEDDLYFQVARTVNRQPIKKEQFDKIITDIISVLDLSQTDVLIDICCGNGLFTYELKDKAGHITGIDFAQNNITTAEKFRSAPNITYRLGDAIDFVDDYRSLFPDLVPTKYLMNDSLAYFSTGDLELMLTNILRLSRNFTFLSRGVPNDVLKWNYYNTEERKQVYLTNLANGNTTNDGLGKWWHPDEIKTVCEKLGLLYQIHDQSPDLSDYRMDVVISNRD